MDGDSPPRSNTTQVYIRHKSEQFQSPFKAISRELCSLEDHPQPHGIQARGSCTHHAFSPFYELLADDFASIIGTRLDMNNDLYDSIRSAPQRLSNPILSLVRLASVGWTH
jgi:hypothetical protein